MSTSYTSLKNLSPFEISMPKRTVTFTKELNKSVNSESLDLDPYETSTNLSSCLLNSNETQNFSKYAEFQPLLKSDDVCNSFYNYKKENDIHYLYYFVLETSKHNYHIISIELKEKSDEIKAQSLNPKPKDQIPKDKSQGQSSK